MLKRLHIKNFQSHKDTTIEFHPGVNYIIGDNDAGKSGIMDALKWNIKNSPNGTEFISHFADKKDITSSEIEYSDGQIVIRERSKDINQYRIEGIKEIKEPFKALSGKVPEEVREVIKLNDINIQEQAEPFFLLAERSGQKIAQKFNEVFGLGIIDTSLTNIKKIVKKAKTDCDYTNEQIKEKQKSIDALSWIDEVNKKLIVLEEIEKKKNIFIETIDKINKIVTDINAVKMNIKAVLVFLAITERYEELVHRNESLVILKKKRTSINKVIDDINKTEMNIKAVLAFLAITERYEELVHRNESLVTVKEKRTIIRKIIEDIVRINKKQSTLKNVISFEHSIDLLSTKVKLSKEITIKGKTIAGIVRAILKMLNSIENITEIIKDKETKYQKMLKDCGICPLCNQSTKTIGKKNG